MKKFVFFQAKVKEFFRGFVFKYEKFFERGNVRNFSKKKCLDLYAWILKLS